MKALFTLAATLLLATTASAQMQEIDGGEPSQSVRHFPITIKESDKKIVHAISTDRFTFRKEPAVFGEAIGRIYISTAWTRASLQIASWNYWDAMFAYEALMELAESGPVHLDLKKPSNFDYEWSRGYQIWDVEVLVDHTDRYSLDEVTSLYRKRQEIENSRYHGFGGFLRKNARRLMGIPGKTCTSLFVTQI